MTDKEFDILIKRAISEHIDEYIPKSETDRTPHKFSEGFKSKMNKLLGRIVTSKHITYKKLILYVTAAIVAASIFTLSAGAARNSFIRFIKRIYRTHTNVRCIADSDAPADFSDKYEITADMSGFELTSVSEDVFRREYIYENEHCTLDYEQHIKEFFNVNENTEGYEMEAIDVKGSEGYYIDWYDNYAKKIVWDNGDYIFTVLVIYDDEYRLNKKELFNIADSVRKLK